MTQTKTKIEIELNGETLVAEVVVVATRTRTAVAGPAARQPGPYKITSKTVALDLGDSRPAHQLRYVEVVDGIASNGSYHVRRDQWELAAGLPDAGDLFAFRCARANERDFGVVGE